MPEFQFYRRTVRILKESVESKFNLLVLKNLFFDDISQIQEIKSITITINGTELDTVEIQDLHQSASEKKEFGFTPLNNQYFLSSMTNKMEIMFSLSTKTAINEFAVKFRYEYENFPISDYLVKIRNSDRENLVSQWRAENHTEYLNILVNHFCIGKSIYNKEKAHTAAVENLTALMKAHNSHGEGKINDLKTAYGFANIILENLDTISLLKGFNEDS